MGIKQAYKLNEKLKNEEINCMICSPLKRTRKTAEIIHQNKKVPILLDERLLEISYGEMEGRLGSEVNNRDGFGNMIDGQIGKNAETSEEFIKRVFDFLEELRGLPQKNILVVTHNEVCKVINIYFNGFPKDKDINKLGLQNCEVIIYNL